MLPKNTRYMAIIIKGQHAIFDAINLFTLPYTLQLRGVCRGCNMLEMTNMNDSQDKQIAKALEDGDIYRFREIINSAAPVNADDIILQICTKNSLKVSKSFTEYYV